MTVLQSVPCYQCSFPISYQEFGQRIKCPFCGATGVAEEAPVYSRIKRNGNRIRVQIPDPLFWGLTGLFAGTFFGPAILGSTEAGSRWLRKQAEQKIG